MEDGVKAYWDNKFKLEVDDPLCGKKTFDVEYKVVWVTSGQDFTMNIYDTYPREGVNGGSAIMFVSKKTSDWVYAHEYGHCIGEPDEYSYTEYADKSSETVKYIKPDGSLDVDVSAPFDSKPSSAPLASIMSTHSETTLYERHGWNVAIEVQELLTSNLGRTIKCTITKK